MKEFSAHVHLPCFVFLLFLKWILALCGLLTVLHLARPSSVWVNVLGDYGSKGAALSLYRRLRPAYSLIFCYRSSIIGKCVADWFHIVAPLVVKSVLCRPFSLDHQLLWKAQKTDTTEFMRRADEVHGGNMSNIQRWWWVRMGDLLEDDRTEYIICTVTAFVQLPRVHDLHGPWIQSTLFI